MSFWSPPLVATTLTLTLLLAFSGVLARLFPPLERYGVPASILAGLAGLAGGPAVLAVLPLDVEVLETGIYHALAVVFIALSLQSPEQPPAGAGPSQGPRAMAFAITTMVALQTVVGLAVVLLLGLWTGALHPGYGLLLPLSFEQGPGQALAMGTAWEASGLREGGQVGLIMAAIGIGWCIVVGVPLALIGRSRGLTSSAASPGSVGDSAGGESRGELTPQLVIVGVVLCATWGVCSAVSAALASLPEIAAMVWGFHFMVGAVLALGARAVLARVPGGSPIDDVHMGRIAQVTVDFATVAALSAVQLSVLSGAWLPVLLISSVGGLVTLAACLFFGLRGFREAPFEHAVLWFGMSTGTLPTGLALLRMIDPELRSPAPLSAVLGSAISIPMVAPIVLLIHPIPIAGWNRGTEAAWLALGVAATYLMGVLVAWRFLGGLRVSPNVDGAAPARS